MAKIGYTRRVPGQNRVPYVIMMILFPSQTRAWQHFRLVYPIMATHLPIGYPLSTPPPDQAKADYSNHSPHTHETYAGNAGASPRWPRRGGAFVVVQQNISALSIIIRGNKYLTTGQTNHEQ